jgi:hypothetical protein
MEGEEGSKTTVVVGDMYCNDERVVRLISSEREEWIFNETPPIDGWCDAIC